MYTKGTVPFVYEYLLSPWDFAAALLILAEAGGLLCDREGRPLDFTVPSGVIAANSPENLQRLISIIKDESLTASFPIF